MDTEIEIIGFSLCKSDWISVCNLIVTSFIGIWLALIVQKNFTINRAIKDYYIQEVKDVRKLYVEMYSAGLLFYQRVYGRGTDGC